MVINVLLLGHSFTYRLQIWYRPKKLLNLNLDSDRLQVFWHGVAELTYPKWNPRNDVCLIDEFWINCIFLDIGSNDLCIPTLSPHQLADNILELCSDIINRGCDVVITLEILQRIDNQSFNEKFDIANRILMTLCCNRDNVFFWTHNRNNFNRRFTRDYVSKDGVHVDNIKDMPRYYSSVWGSILLAEKYLNNV